MFLTLSIVGSSNAMPLDVDLELSLLVDVSGSISANEFNLQRQGYVNAFQNVSIWNAIDHGAFSRIAVNLVYWSGKTQQAEVVGWTLIDSQTAANTFANAISGTTRHFGVPPQFSRLCNGELIGLLIMVLTELGQ